MPRTEDRGWNVPNALACVVVLAEKSVKLQ